MFKLNDFKRILDETTVMLEKKNTVDEDDREEMEMAIESNIHALRIICRGMENKEMQAQAEKILRTLAGGSAGNEKIELFDEPKPRGTKNAHTDSRNESINNELYKNSVRLRQMAERFGESLKEDKKVVQRVANKMEHSSVGSKINMKKLDEGVRKVSSSTFLMIAVLLFVVMYFIIRFL
ncbi:hypothetical protein ENBRE01_1571 [Enteropsectra breve]|nr:hypothetical protein ENBRE01_1571 [Enteropsectra breve]